MAPTGGGGGVPKPAGGRVPSDQVGAGPDGFLADHVAGMGRCDHHVVPGVDAIVVDVPGVVVEDDDVTRLLRILRQVLARGVLVDGEVRQPYPESAEDDHDQAGAVERVWTGGAPLVGGAVVGGGLGHDRVAKAAGARGRRRQRGQRAGQQQDEDDGGGPDTLGQSIGGHDDSEAAPTERRRPTGFDGRYADLEPLSSTSASPRAEALPPMGHPVLRRDGSGGSTTCSCLLYTSDAADE